MSLANSKHYLPISRMTMSSDLVALNRLCSNMASKVFDAKLTHSKKNTFQESADLGGIEHSIGMAAMKSFACVCWRHLREYRGDPLLHRRRSLR